MRLTHALLLSLALAMALPAACYAVIAFFGFYARQPLGQGRSS